MIEQSLIDQVVNIWNPTGAARAALTSSKGFFFPACKNSFTGACPKHTGEMKKCTVADCEGADIRTVDEELIRRNIEHGGKRLGIYPMLPDNMTAWVAVDFDNHSGISDAVGDVGRLADHCAALEIPLFVFSSNSGAGYHAYLFFSEPVPAYKGRAFLLWLAESAGAAGALDCAFPKQDRLGSRNPLGNLIAMPWNRRAVEERGATLYMRRDYRCDPGVDIEENIGLFLDYFEAISPGELDGMIESMGVPLDPGGAAAGGGKGEFRVVTPEDVGADYREEIEYIIRSSVSILEKSVPGDRHNKRIAVGFRAGFYLVPMHMGINDIFKALWPAALSVTDSPETAISPGDTPEAARVELLRALADGGRTDGSLEDVRAYLRETGEGGIIDTTGNMPAEILALLGRSEEGEGPKVSPGSEEGEGPKVEKIPRGAFNAALRALKKFNDRDAAYGVLMGWNAKQIKPLTLSQLQGAMSEAEAERQRTAIADTGNGTMLQSMVIQVYHDGSKRYLLKLENGDDVRMEADDLTSNLKFRKRLMEATDNLMMPVRADVWVGVVNSLFASATTEYMSEEEASYAIVQGIVERSYLQWMKRVDELPEKIPYDALIDQGVVCCGNQKFLKIDWLSKCLGLMNETEARKKTRRDICDELRKINWVPKGVHRFEGGTVVHRVWVS